MERYKQSLGKYGEDAAAEFLKKKKYKILERNLKNRFGEIDIIAKHKGDIVFIEVKTRFSKKYGAPYEAVNYYKQERITSAAKAYLCNKKLFDANVRFDIVEVYGGISDGRFELDKIEHIEYAIEQVKQF